MKLIRYLSILIVSSTIINVWLFRYNKDSIYRGGDATTMLEEFYVLLNSKDWIKNYIFWELELFKSLGYDLNFENLVNEKIIGDQKQYISKSSTDKRIIPNFLIDKNNSTEDIGSLLTGLKLLSDYLEKSILKPNNLNQPISRLQFINTLK